MPKQQLSSPRETDYKCPECGTITTVKSFSMTPTTSITCIDCGTRVFEESQTDINLTIERLHADRESLRLNRRSLLSHVSVFNLGTKHYRDLTIQEASLVAEQSDLIGARIKELENIKGD